jgi:alkyl hydroperoxide reductase subunit F
MNDTKVVSITGGNMVSAVKIERSGKTQELKVEGVFVEIGLIPNSSISADVAKNDSGEIKVDSYNRTNVPGIFAAGDVTDVPEKQIIIAAGEGSKAALTAFRYLSRQR